jgi:hypothetical protein
MCVLCGGYIEPKYESVGAFVEYSCPCKTRVVNAEWQQVLDGLTRCSERSLVLNGMVIADTWFDQYVHVTKTDVALTRKKVEAACVDAPEFKEQILDWLKAKLLLLKS